MLSVVLSCLLVIGNAKPNASLYDHNQYLIKYQETTGEKWIENSHGQKVVVLANFLLYDNGQRLKLTSRLGFTLENIPMNNERFYNESIEIFLEAEEQLPKAYECLRQSGMRARAINTLHLAFPGTPIIDEKGFTKIWEEHGYTCTKDGQLKRGPMWIRGQYRSGSDVMIVTLSLAHYDYITVHEYIHACGYGHICDKDKAQEEKNFRCAKKPLVNTSQKR